MHSPSSSFQLPNSVWIALLSSIGRAITLRAVQGAVLVGSFLVSVGTTDTKGEPAFSAITIGTKPSIFNCRWFYRILNCQVSACLPSLYKQFEASELRLLLQIELLYTRSLNGYR